MAGEGSAEKDHAGNTEYLGIGRVMVRGVRGYDEEGVTSCIFIYLQFLHLRI